MADITIICCYNNVQILEAMLKKSLQEQVSISIETIFLNGKYTSAANAFADAIQSANSNHLLFVHQDMMFTQPDFLRLLIDEIEKEKKAIYGLCGSILESNRAITYSNVFHGLWNKNIGRAIEKKTRVKGLDEIMVAFHKDLTTHIQFDATTLNGWHLYVEDICLSAEIQDIPVYVLPLTSQHKGVLEMPGYMRSYGILPKEYFRLLWKLRKKYADKVDHIVCPCISIKTSTIPFLYEFVRKYLYHRRRKFFRDLSFI